MPVSRPIQSETEATNKVVDRVMSVEPDLDRKTVELLVRNLISNAKQIDDAVNICAK